MKTVVLKGDLRGEERVGLMVAPLVVDWVGQMVAQWVDPRVDPLAE